MPVFKKKDINTVEAFPGVTLKKGIDRESGSGSVTLGEMTVERGHGLPKHVHTVEDCMFILEGKGQVKIGENIYDIEKGDQVLVPAGTPHFLKNIGDEPLRLIFIYPSVNVDRTLVK